MSDFKKDIPDYKSYQDTDNLYFSSIPNAAWSGFPGLIRKAAENTDNLKSIINTFAEIIPTELTKSWTYEWLENEICKYVSAIRTKTEDGKINKFFDCLAVLGEVGNLSVEEINEFLEDNNIGYEIYKETFSKRLIWCMREGASAAVEDITTAQSATKSVSHQAYEEFERAKKSLEDAADERARKDAVRSCISALEAVVKKYGGAPDIKAASKKLRDSKKWGLDDIVKQGDAIFNNMHRLYPDLRHGSIEVSTMSLEEAEYWIGRISVYLQYMKKMADKNGVE